MRVLYFISTFLLDRHLGFEPTLQLKGWNSRALQNETHMRASILMNTGPLPRPMASQKALLRNPVGPHDGLVPKASNSGIFPSCPNQKAARLGSVRFGSRPLRPNLAAPLSFRLGGRVGKEGGGGGCLAGSLQVAPSAEVPLHLAGDMVTWERSNKGLFVEVEARWRHGFLSHNESLEFDWQRFCSNVGGFRWVVCDVCLYLNMFMTVK